MQKPSPLPDKAGVLSFLPSLRKKEPPLIPVTNGVLNKEPINLLQVKAG
jgi:hypothetical protein